MKIMSSITTSTTTSIDSKTDATSLLLVHDNNNDINNSKTKMTETITRTVSSSPPHQFVKPQQMATKQVSSSSKRRRCRCAVHLNNLWSLWYGIFGTALQAYIIIKSLKRLLGYSLLAWPDNIPIPYLELNCSLGLIGATILLLPIFLMATIFKIGNLANDGFKIGRQLSTCSKEPPADILATKNKNGTCRIFRHGGPTAPFVHLVIAFCLLVPKLLMEARLIEAGFLSQDWLWRTDLDFIGIHKDRLVILSFMTANNATMQQHIKVNNHQHSSNPLGGGGGIDNNKMVNPSTMPLISNSIVTNTVMKTLKDYIGHENHTNYENRSVETGWGSSVSVEYMNLALALLVYSIRYPALFWSTNKCLGIIFSFQLLINSLHTLLAYAGMSILYKVQIIGGWKSLPLLKHEPSINNGGLFMLNRNTSPFLLNSQVTLALYMLSTLLILSSSLVLYLYGYTRFNAFLNQERERKVITLKNSGSNKWGYFTHCAALCVLISVSICNAPLLHDYTVLYKGSLDDTTLACIVGGLLHLFFWIVIWLFLTIKQSWIFKLRVTVGRATVRQARSLRLVTDIDLMSASTRPEDLAQQPLLIIGNGRTYNVTETSPKRAIMNVIQKAAITKKLSMDGNNHQQQQQQSQHQNPSGGNNDNDDDEEQIYWLRPALVTPQSSPDQAKPLCWFKSKTHKHKVTFNDTTSTSANNRHNKNGGIRGRRLTTMNEDDGDYATLRELPLPPPPPMSSCQPDNKDDAVSEEGKLLACVHDEHVTYASNNHHDLVPPVDYEDPSPLLTPSDTSSSHQLFPPHKTPLAAVTATTELLITTAVPVTVHSQNIYECQSAAQMNGHTPRCLRRADSGMPTDELATPRSDSDSSNSAAHDGSGGGSETSSGVHSNDSAGATVAPTENKQRRRATSVVDLMVQSRSDEVVQWKSSSLQRNVAPPSSTAGTPSSITGVILENPTQNTVVIRRNKLATNHHRAMSQTDHSMSNGSPSTSSNLVVVATDEPLFGRATNMRMTSFMEKNEMAAAMAANASSTLPHYPTAQPVQSVYAHCSTMPLPQQHNANTTNLLLQANSTNQHKNLIGSTSSCNVYPPRPHTTLPTHHNGVKLFHTNQLNTSAPAPYQNVVSNGGGRFKCRPNDCYNNKININEAIYTGINKVSGEMYHYNS